MKSVRIRIPEKLYRKMDVLINQGWFSDHEAVVELALRKFLNSYRPEMIDRFLHEDVQWGLRAGK
jgi:Arc/MetJ-type ribon-helix-helix transcriptional regulator